MIIRFGDDREPEPTGTNERKYKGPELLRLYAPGPDGFLERVDTDLREVTEEYKKTVQG